MIFHIVGVACVAGSLIGDVHNHPVCTDYENPQDYSSIIDCNKKVDKVKTPLPLIKGQKIAGEQWIILHCIQMPVLK